VGEVPATRALESSDKSEVEEESMAMLTFTDTLPLTLASSSENVEKAVAVELVAMLTDELSATDAVAILWVTLD
jgi:hypothetical protein